MGDGGGLTCRDVLFSLLWIFPVFGAVAAVVPFFFFLFSCSLCRDAGVLSVDEGLAGHELAWVLGGLPTLSRPGGGPPSPARGGGGLPSPPPRPPAPPPPATLTAAATAAAAAVATDRRRRWPRTDGGRGGGGGGAPRGARAASLPVSFVGALLWWPLPHCLLAGARATHPRHGCDGHLAWISLFLWFFFTVRTLAEDTPLQQRATHVRVVGLSFREKGP